MAVATGPPAWLVDILLAAEATATLQGREGHSEVTAYYLGSTVPIKPVRISHGVLGDVPMTKTAPDACTLAGKVGRDNL